MTEAKRSGLLSVALRVAGVVLAALVLWGAVLLYQSQQPPAQPLEFNHQRHVQDLGISCLYCHSNAQRGVSAGLPSLTKCMACHNSIEPKTAAEKRLHEFAARKGQGQGGPAEGKGGPPEGRGLLRPYAMQDEPIPWVPVAMQPDFVYFSHRPHVNAGIACETCHGEVGQMTVAEPIKDQNMGWCLSCHKNMADDAEHFVKLSDCATCHK